MGADTERDDDAPDGDYDESATSSAADEEQAQDNVQELGASQGGKGRPE